MLKKALSLWNLYVDQSIMRNFGMDDSSSEGYICFQSEEQLQD